MRLVKIFKSIENEMSTMEKEINTWIQESGAQVISVTGNISPQTHGPGGHAFSSSDILVVVLYEPSV